MAKNTSMRIDDKLYEDILSRGKLTEVFHRDLERLYSLYNRCLAEVKLSLPEAMLIVDALNGSIFDMRSAPLLYASIEDAIRLDDLDKKWEVDGPALVERLKALPVSHCLAIIDAAERVWQEVSKQGAGEGLEDIVKRCFNIQ